jgi:DHA1 family bicyclomycin/chloramphenicol resistance-like MFS transporter
MVLSVAPVVAPTLGSVALSVGGWRTIYGFLGAAGAALLLSVYLGLAETRHVSPDRARARTLSGFSRMLGHRRAFGFALTNAMGFGALFAYVSGSPLVLMGTLGVAARTYAMLFAIISSGIVGGAWVNSRVARNQAAADLALACALIISCLTAVLLLVVSVQGVLSLANLLPLLIVHAFCRGITSPNATHGALEPMGDIAGLASAVVGCAQMATGALSSALVALLFPSLGSTAMALVMTGFSAAAVLAWNVARKPAAALMV